MNIFRTLLSFGVLSLSVLSHAWVIDFEDQTATSFNYNYPGSYTSLDITTEGHQVSIYRNNPAFGFDITDNSTMPGDMPAEWGGRSLAPFGSVVDWMVFNFETAAINEFSAQLGDLGGDSDTIQWEAYEGLDGTGGLIQTGSLFYGTASLPSTYMTAFDVFRLPARSVRLRGWSSSSPNGMFIDNFSNQAVPEPATMTILGLGALVALKRRKRS